MQSVIEYVIIEDLDGQAALKESAVPIPTLHGLTISRTHLKSINMDTFENLETLTTMRIADNHELNEIQPNAFRGLYSLVELNIVGNDLPVLKSKMFTSLDDLVKLDCTHNSIKMLEEDVFQPLVNVQVIDLELNRLEYIPENLFYNNHKLKEINLGYNDLIKVEAINSRQIALPYPNAYEIKFDVEKVILRNNKNIVINETAFRDMKKLKYLDLDSNKLSKMEDFWFFFAESMETLKMQDNLFTEIRVETFEKLQELRELDLSFNKISNLELGCFNNQKKLIKLRLDHNELSQLPEDMFKNLVVLEELELANNKIGLLHPNVFKNLKGLQVLTLNNNQIVGLQKGVFDSLRNLRSLTLNSNRISFIDSNTFASLKGIYTLDLSDNLFEDIAKETFNLQHYGSQKKIFDSKLTNVKLSKNRLKELKAYSFIPLVKVTVMDISENSISKIENGTFQKMPLLKALSLRRNQIEFLPEGIFDSLSYLSNLDLVHNKLSSFPDNVFTLPTLTHVYLNFNRINQISPKALNNTYIVELSLFGNLLTFLPYELFENAQHLQRVVLEGNPFQCACYDTIVELLEKRNIQRDRHIGFIQDPRVGTYEFKQGQLPICVVTKFSECVQNNDAVTSELIDNFNEMLRISHQACHEIDYCYKDNLPAKS